MSAERFAGDVLQAHYRAMHPQDYPGREAIYRRFPLWCARVEVRWRDSQKWEHWKSFPLHLQRALSQTAHSLYNTYGSQWTLFLDWIPQELERRHYAHPTFAHHDAVFGYALLKHGGKSATQYVREGVDAAEQARRLRELVNLPNEETP